MQARISKYINSKPANRNRILKLTKALQFSQSSHANNANPVQYTSRLEEHLRSFAVHAGFISGESTITSQRKKHYFVPVSILRLSNQKVALEFLHGLLF